MNSAADIFSSALEHHQSGRLAEAESLYRQILAEDPGHVGSLNFLGVAAHQHGRHQEAVDLIGRAITLNEAIPDCHNNLGEALRALRRYDEAVAAFERAIALDPGFAEAHNNLGNALAGQDQLDAAVQAFRRALALDATALSARVNLAKALYRLRRLDESAETWRSVLAQAPGHAEAAENLAAILTQQGDRDGAAAVARRLLGGQTLPRDALESLATLLLTNGDPHAAAEAAYRALTLQETISGKALLAQVLVSMREPPDLPDIEALLTRALSEPWARPADLARVAANVLRRNPTLGPLLERMRVALPIYMLGDLSAAEIEQVAAVPMLQTLLVSAVVWDAEFERLLTVLRRMLLKRAFDMPGRSTGADPSLPLWCALAQQCFINEYVFTRSGDEITKLSELFERLGKSLAAGAPVPALWPVAIAAYGPLHAMREADALLERAWPEPVRELLRLQVREPRAEIDDRSAIARLTAINDPVSKQVRQQYEENPYPRWIRIAPVASFGIDATVQARFPDSHFRPLGKGDEIDVLVAGCGTGQQAIETAQRLPQARITAVDLSLASLAHARRHARAAGLSRIRFAQADILALGTLGRTFDLIEASGVLHHLRDPMGGLRILRGMMAPNGVMRLGLYSAIARQNLSQVRAWIDDRGYAPSPDDIRRCRQELLQHPPGTPQHYVAQSPDFFSTSSCRDLLFHVQEHQLSLPELKKMLAAADLRFLGFDHDPFVLARYRERFPADAGLTDLDSWHLFETENPQTFAVMYQFWAQDAGRTDGGSPQRSPHGR